jgi:hypothetical protein
LLLERHSVDGGHSGGLMFRTLAIDGGAEQKMDATISWAWHTAAVLRPWHVRKNDKGQWSLLAQIVRVDSFKLQQRPLRFNVPRKGGHYSWSVRAVTVSGPQLTAALGPMEA